MAGHRYVAVIGGAEPDDECVRLAREVGALLARAGVILLTGGRGGVMAAACAGATAAGGVSIGILPGESRHDANPFQTYSIPTGLGQARNALIALAADALIAVGGSYGTLSEIGHALRLGRTVVGLRTWRLDGAGRQGGIVVAHTAAEAVRTAVAALRVDRPGCEDEDS